MPCLLVCRPIAFIARPQAKTAKPKKWQEKALATVAPVQPWVCLGLGDLLLGSTSILLLLRLLKKAWEFRDFEILLRFCCLPSPFPGPRLAEPDSPYPREWSVLLPPELCLIYLEAETGVLGSRGILSFLATAEKWTGKWTQTKTYSIWLPTVFRVWLLFHFSGFHTFRRQRVEEPLHIWCL